MAPSSSRGTPSPFSNRAEYNSFPKVFVKVPTYNRLFVGWHVPCVHSSANYCGQDNGMSWMTRPWACAISSTQDWEEKGESPKEHQNMVPRKDAGQLRVHYSLKWSQEPSQPLRSDHSINRVYPSTFLHPQPAEIWVLFFPKTLCCMSSRPSPPVLIFRSA